MSLLVVWFSHRTFFKQYYHLDLPIYWVSIIPAAFLVKLRYARAIQMFPFS